MIPSCLTLTEGQRAKLEEFRASLAPISIEEHDEAFGGACMSSRLEFRCSDTSIGFNLSVHDVITGKSISLLTDEDIENA
jgi:hypothetical protein